MQYFYDIPSQIKWAQIKKYCENFPLRKFSSRNISLIYVFKTIFWKKCFLWIIGCRVWLCDFHQEQAWVRWLTTIANGMRQDKDKALAFLRNVSLSETVDEYHANLRTLKISNIWSKTSSVTFRNWIEKTWLPLDKVCF